MSTGLARKFKVQLSDAFVHKALKDPRVRKILDQVQHLDASHDVPYLGGISSDGKTVYLDKRLPRVMDFQGKKLDVWRHIAVHEATEHALMKGLGLDYRRAHHIATKIENASVKLAGVDPGLYERRLKPYIRAADAESVKDPPKDLYKKPYKDEHDKKELKKLQVGDREERMVAGATGWAGSQIVSSL